MEIVAFLLIAQSLAGKKDDVYQGPSRHDIKENLIQLSLLYN